jgi:hypothetical protein
MRDASQKQKPVNCFNILKTAGKNGKEISDRFQYFN